MPERQQRTAVVMWLALVMLAAVAGGVLVLAFTVPSFLVPPAAAVLSCLGTAGLAATLAKLTWPVRES